MTRKEKAEAIRACLDRLYPDPPIPLLHSNAFTMCIAVLLSAHTTDKSVNSATPALFKLADNAADMAKLSPERIEALIKRVGLSKTKSRNVWNLSRILLEKHGGQLPRTMEELEELPGVGHKTASVVMAQAFGVPAFAVDTHIHRLAERWGLSDGKNVVQTETDLKAVFPRETWSKVHLQMIYYGREHCPARNHDLDRCEICARFATPATRKAALNKIPVDKAARDAKKAVGKAAVEKGGKKVGKKVGKKKAAGTKQQKAPEKPLTKAAKSPIRARS